MSRHATSACVVIAVVLATVTTGISRAEQGEQGIVVLNDNDLRRGYVVHWGAAKPPFEPARPVKVAIGNEEKESFELGVFALRDVGTVSLSVRSTPELPEQSLRLRTMQGISTSMGVQKFGWGVLTVGRKGVDAPMEWKDYALLDGSDLDMAAGAHKSFWLTLDGNRIPPGRYVLNLGIEPEHSERRDVQLTLEVIDVRLEREGDLHLMMYHNDSCLQQHRPEVFRKHLQLMRETGQRQFRIDPGFRQHRRSVKFRWNKQGEIEADYAGIDRLLKTARELGFDVFGWPTNGGVSEDWLSAELKSLPDEKRQALKNELTRRFFQHILDLGFREIWWYCIDEPPIEQATDPKFIKLLRSFKQEFPMLRPHCALNKYRPHLVTTLNPWMDIWMVDGGVLTQMHKDIANGTIAIDATDAVGPYSSAYYHYSPDGLRGGGWAAAARKVTYFAYFAYGSRYSKSTPYVSFSCPTGNHGTMPFSTPGLEGVREGYEDRALWHTLDVLLDRLETKHDLTRRHRDRVVAARAFRERLLARTSEESLIPWKMRPANDGRGFGPHRIMQANDRWLLRRVKGDLLRHIESLQTLRDK